MHSGFSNLRSALPVNLPARHLGFRVRAGAQADIDRVTVLRRECLDHVLILNERHVQQIVKEYVAYYNRARPHQGIGQRIPEATEAVPIEDRLLGTVVGRPILGGLHYDYRRAA